MRGAAISTENNPLRQYDSVPSATKLITFLQIHKNVKYKNVRFFCCQVYYLADFECKWLGLATAAGVVVDTA